MSLTWCLSQKAARSTQKSKATVPSYLAIFSHRKTAATKQCLCFRLGSALFKTRAWRQRQARENCASAQKAACYSSYNHSSWKMVFAKGSLHAWATFIVLVGRVQGFALQREQLHVHKGRYPHFPRARALRERHRACEGRKYIYLLVKLCFWDNVRKVHLDI